MYPVNSNFHSLSTQDAPKTRTRIYFIDDTVDCTNDTDVQTNGTLLVWAAGDTDSNGRAGDDGIRWQEYFNRDKNIEIGAAVSSQIEIPLINMDGALNNFSFGRCKVYLDVYDTANSTWRVCPMGVYIIDLPTKRRVKLISASGYDQMQLLDAICDSWWSGLNWSGGITLSALLTSMANQLGVKVSTATASAILNSSVSYTEAPFACVEVTYREVLEYIAEATGTIARFDRDGYLDLRFFSAAKIGGNTVTINADTVGNTCLDIDIAEYQAAAIDLLKVKIAEDDIGVTVGSGTNQYTIVNNLFLYGSTATIITNRATPIYNRLNGLGAYTPIQAKLIYDWSLEAGDIINIVRDSTTYPVLIFQQTLTWRGGYVTADILADGDNVRPVMDYNERASYRMASEMSAKVGDNEIISKINQTAEQIQIQASKVNLTGYITATNLATAGQTVINGGNITTGTIDASVVTVDNINASNISSGTLSAARIAAGSLAIGKLDSAAQNTINGANSQEQLIYRSKAAGTTSLSKTTTWITNTTGNQDTWTLKRPTYNSSYPVLFIATQRKDVGGTVTCTTPQIDNTTTVIDGGHITTGTIDASVVSVTNLNASNISSGTLSAARIGAGSITANKLDSADINASKILTVGSMTDAAAATVLNSNISIGGRNLCTGTAVSNEFTKSTSGDWFVPIGAWPISTYGGTAFADTANTQWTASFDYSITGVDVAFTLRISIKTSASSYSGGINVASIPVGSSSGHAEGTGTITDGARDFAGTSGVLFTGMADTNTNAVLTVSNLKLEIGNKATSWTQAPEDVAADIATAQTTADSANSQEQLIYISKASGTTTQSATTTWVTNATGNQNTWTIKRPTYNSSYPVLFVATQRKSVGGTVTCTTPQIDNTTTVIDGGHITTGTIDASVVSVTNLNASNITSGTMSASKISGGTLTLGGSSNTNGTMTVLDATGVTAATVDNTGITVNGTHTIGGSSKQTTLVLSDGSIVSQTNGENSFKVGRNSLGGGSLLIYKEISGVGGNLTNDGITFIDGTKAKIRYDYNGFIIRYDNGYGVTDSPAVQLFHQSSTGSSITFATPPGDSGASTVIGSAGSTFGANTTFSANATVNGVLDVTNRRCYDSLSSEGWYRVCQFDFATLGEAIGAAGGILHLSITDSYGTNANDSHTIDLLFAHNKITFANETSAGNYLGVDKIRYTFNSSSPYDGFVDIHWVGGSSIVGVTFDYDCIALARQAKLTAMGLVGVAASPADETVLTTYTFAANTEANGSATAGSGVTINEMDIKRSGRIVYVHFYATGTFAANTSYTLGTLSGVPMPTKHIRWMAGGGGNAYNATTPVYAILDYTNSKITAYASAACNAINITVSYIV